MEGWKPEYTTWKLSAFIKVWCFVASVSKKESWNHFLTKNYCGKPSKSFEWVHVNKPDWPLQQHGETTLTANTAKALLHDFFCCRIARLRPWPPRSQTSRHPTSSCEDFLTKESTAVTPKAWSSLNITLNGLLPTLTNKLFYKLPGTLWKGEGFSWRTFSKSAKIARFNLFITMFNTFLVPFK